MMKPTCSGKETPSRRAPSSISKRSTLAAKPLSLSFLSTDLGSRLDKALLACDELTGFVGACALVRPDGIASLQPKSVLKKLKDKGFAAKVERHEIEEGARLLGVELDAHIGFVIGALTPHAAELLLAGQPAAQG